MQDDYFTPFRVLVKNYNHFVNLSNRFDCQYNTKTYVATTTLKQIADTLKKDKNRVNASIQNLVNSVFANSNIILSNNENQSPIVTLNACADMVRDINNNIFIKHPVCMFFFKHNKWFVHPGNTRLLFANQYFYPVDVVITNYSKRVITKKCTFDLHNTSDLVLDSVKGLDFFTYWTNSNARRSFKKKVGRGNYLLKELEDIATVEVLRNPKNYNPPRIYEYKNAKVYMNGTEFLRHINDNWFFCI